MSIHRVLPSCQGWPLHSAVAMRALEAASQAGLAPGALMQRAGVAAAQLAAALCPHARRMAVLAGPGNNGGDGIEAARQLHRRGRDVHLQLLADPDRLPADARAALERAHADGLPIHRLCSDAVHLPADADLTIDALLGLGASRAPEGTLAAATGAFNAQPGVRLSLDLPSGLDGDTGMPFGPACARATHTLSLLGLRPGLFTGQGRDHAGTVWLDDLRMDSGADLGIKAQDSAADAWLTGPPRSPTATRPHASHKGSYGNVAVIGGAHGMVGAPLLAARAALAAGAGRVYVGLLDADGPTHDADRPELMFRRAVGDDADLLAQATVVCGCGGGSTVAIALPRVIATAARLVLDADALTALAADPMLRELLHHRAARGRATVLTPHPLEAARLLDCGTAAVQADRLAAARQLADAHRCVVVLKGSGTVVAAPSRRPGVNPTGNAALATAGTGDVLAGWIGGLWSGLPEQSGISEANAQAAAVAEAAVWLHGAAADTAGRRVLRAADLVEQLVSAG